MGAAAEHLHDGRTAMLREDDAVHMDMEGSMKLQPDSVEEYRANVYEAAYHYGWSCGFATAAATSLIVLILYGMYVRFFPNGIPIVF